MLTATLQHKPPHCPTAKARQPPPCPFPPFISSPICTALPLFYPFCPSVTGQRLLTGTRLGPEPRKSFNRPIRTGADPRAAIRETRAPTPDPLVSHSLFCVLDALQIEHHPPTLSSHFVNDRSGKEERVGTDMKMMFIRFMEEMGRKR